jgi:hypothetical protein
VLVGLGLLLLLIGYDVVNRSLRGTTAVVRAPEPKQIPPFRVGDLAPDFALPDSSGSTFQLSHLVSRDTLLCFTCGCSNCLDLQTYLGILVKRMGAKAPDVITVTTMPRDREATWFRDTHLKQRFLYERKEGPVVANYRGHPCPRVFRLKGDRTVAWIGTSPTDVDFFQLIGNEMAENLGFAAERPVGPGMSGPEKTPDTVGDGHK